MSTCNFGPTYPIKMATFDLQSSINSLSDTPILPCFQGYSVVQAKLLDFGVFKPLGPNLVFEALSSLITSMDMLVIAPSKTPQPVPMQLMTLEALCQAMRQKLRVEAQPLLGDDYVNAFDDLKALVEANDESSEQAMMEIQQLCFKSTLEAISCASVKKGALYMCPFTQKPCLMLGSRGLFVTDKARVAAAMSKQNKTQKLSGKSAAKRSNKKDGKATINPQGKPRRTISDDDEEETKSNVSLEDVSCHGGDGESPYDSEWAHSPRSSNNPTPILAPQAQEDEPSQLSLSQLASANVAPTIDDTPRPPLNIQLTPNPLVPLIPAGVLGPVFPLGGSLGSVPVASAPMKQSKKRSKKHAKTKKAKKTKKPRSRSSSPSPSSTSSIEVPPPKPSADQVFLLCLYSLLV